MMALQLFQPPLSASSGASSTTSAPNSSLSSSVQTLHFIHNYHVRLPPPHHHHHHHCQKMNGSRRGRRGSISGLVVFVGKEETQLRVPSTESVDDQSNNDEEDEEDVPPTPQDLEDISQIKRVLELLKKNRDMIFSEVKLTIMIEDPREVERRRLLGIDDSEAPTRDDLAAVLEEVNEGKIPKNRVALRMLAEELIQWPNLEVEIPKKKRGKSLYAKTTDTGVDPEVAAKRLNIDWDTAANIDDADVTDDTEVPSAVGYGALYLVTAFPVLIGISVVLILFYNSLQ